MAKSPPAILNVTGPETVAVRDLAGRIGRLLGKEPRFVSQEAATALLSNASACFERFGRPAMSLDEMIRAIVPWVAAGKPVLGKPTKYGVRDGRFLRGSDDVSRRSLKASRTVASFPPTRSR